MKKLTTKFYGHFACRKLGDIEEAVEMEGKLCNVVPTVREFTYLGDRVSAGENCKVAVASSKGCSWVRLRECGDLLYANRFSFNLKDAVYKSYESPSILFRS